MEIVGLKVHTCHKYVTGGGGQRTVIYPIWDLTFLLRLVCEQDKYVVNFKSYSGLTLGDIAVNLSEKIREGSREAYYMDLPESDLV